MDIKMTKKGNMSLLNGINFGCQYEGYYDHPIVFFASIASQFFNEVKMSKERRQEFLMTLA